MAFNKVILIGNLTSDPELKQTPSGITTTTFNLAVNRKVSKDGEQNCDFITIVAWRATAEFICKYFKKGNPILVCGQLQTRTWTDKQGNKRYATEVLADEVSFVGGKESPTEAKSQPYNPYLTPASILGGGGHKQPQFEEVASDIGLPF